MCKVLTAGVPDPSAAVRLSVLLGPSIVLLCLGALRPELRRVVSPCQLGVCLLTLAHEFSVLVPGILCREPWCTSWERPD
jgi:hypothetical protein